jgi:secreted trypsin-like serine protease
MHPSAIAKQSAPLLAVVTTVLMVSATAGAGASPRAHASVVGGAAVGEGTLPEIAFVVDQLSPTEVGLCTGTVVAPRLILTAGHCVEDATTGQLRPAGGFIVVSGVSDWHDPERQLSTVTQVAVFPRFNPRIAEGDAGVLVLSTPTTAPTVRLAGPHSRALRKAGTGALVAGFGRVSPLQHNFSGALHWGDTVLQRSRYCKSQMPLAFHHRYELCAIDTPSFKTTTCEGDSGGPLMVSAGSSEELVQIGITSFGAAACLTHRPSVFTRVDAIVRWVKRWIHLLATSPPPIGPPPPSTPQPTEPPSPGAPTPAVPGEAQAPPPSGA